MYITRESQSNNLESAGENLMDLTKLYAVIMAGGKGKRFWPAGRADRPKQLLPLLGDKTMIEETVQRLFPLIAPERLLVITNTAYAGSIRSLLPIPPENVIGEPEGRDTAPCVALATALVRRRDPDATMILLPADHVIRPARLFQETLLAAAGEAQKGSLVTLGITPAYPATGYGYLQLGEPVSPGFHQVTAFKEKPDAATAETFFQDGNYRWNSGMFIWQCTAISRAFARYAPDLSEYLEAWSRGADYTADFARCRKISIDYAVMEKADNVVAGNAGFYWNDLGSWSSLRSILPLDGAGNAVRGNAAVLDAANNVLWGDDQHQIGVIGMHDIAVIQSGNGILVCPLSAEQRVKELIQQLNKEWK